MIYLPFKNPTAKPFFVDAVVAASKKNLFFARGIASLSIENTRFSIVFVSSVHSR